MLTIRAKLTLQMLQMPLHTHPSHQDEPFQSEMLELLLKDAQE